MNVGLDKPNFRRDNPYRAENLAIDEPTFIAKIQVYFFRVPNTKSRKNSIKPCFAAFVVSLQLWIMCIFAK